MKIARLQRILKLLTMLQSDRFYGPQELADELGVSRRTFFRDLDMLYKAGIPYYFDEEKGGYRVDRHCFLPPLNLTLPEALALMLTTQPPGDKEPLPLLTQARNAAMKIESMLPAHIQQQCGSVMKTTSTRHAATARHLQLDETLTLLQQAIRQRRRVEITYISFFEKKQLPLTLHPYHLHFAQRAWYVIGYSQTHKETRTFKMGRIKKAKLLKSRYLREKPFQIDEYLGDAWSLIPEGKLYKVKLYFAPLVAGNVAEVLWHRKQKLTRHDDGTLTFEVEVDGLGEITWWLLGYGDQVEVVKPPELRRRVKKIARKMIKIYDQK
ncbi:helix-turn-helix transcriptional regulator [Planctomycetota bacterium]